MDNNKVHDYFRKQLTGVHALTVLTVSLFEIIGYAILVHSRVETFSLQNRYLWVCVVLPILVNLTTHAVTRVIVSRAQVQRKTKNAAIITAALITSFIVAVLHKEYIITSCAFVFPMILSAMFNDKKLLNASFVSSLLILICVALAFQLDHTANLVTGLNLFVLFAFAIVSYFCGILSINFSKMNYITIQSQAEKNARLRDDVMRDRMTELYNHESFVNDLEKRVREFDPAKPFCFAMLDVDDFKKINDTYGHDCGDEVLIFLADAMRAHCGEHATPYRYGGEEFAIIFDGKKIHEAAKITEDLLQTIRRHRFEFTDAPVTFSAGIAEYSDGLSCESFFEKADQTLYRAKGEGKNRVLMA